MAVPIQDPLKCNSFIVLVNVMYSQATKMLCSFEYSHGNPWPTVIPYKFIEKAPNFVKNYLSKGTGIICKKNCILGKMLILTILICPIHVKEVLLQDRRSSQILPNRGA